MAVTGPVIAGMRTAVNGGNDADGDGTAWADSNCYADLWMSILRALRLDPTAVLAFFLTIDFEGDQWTFAKPSHGDLWSLYRIEVEELNVWESLADHVGMQVARGRMPLIEVDSFFLPDTRDIAYHTVHTKTTIGINEIDLPNRHLSYFHNTGYFELGGDDFCGIFSGAAPTGEALPPYAEFAKLERRVPMAPGPLRRASFAAARVRWERRPPVNPFTPYRAGFPHDAERLSAAAADFHGYAFANPRQFGAAFHWAGVYLRWLDVDRNYGVAEAAEPLERIADGAKTLLLKAARAAARRTPLDADALLAVMEAEWHQAADLLDRAFGAATAA